MEIECGTGGGTIDAVEMASWGQPNIMGDCPDWKAGSGMMSCHAEATPDVIKKLCVGQASCATSAVSANFGGDPCDGVSKMLAVRVHCTGPEVASSKNFLSQLGI
jgi:hypothetical protein